MRRLFVQLQARVDLLEIWRHIAEKNLAAADIVGGKLDEAIRGLALMLGKGHTRPDVKDLRYRFDDESLTVIRVVHGRRNFRSIFRGHT
jgi:plasmid stabilization system protein ParE